MLAAETPPSWGPGRSEKGALPGVQGRPACPRGMRQREWSPPSVTGVVSRAQEGRRQVGQGGGQGAQRKGPRVLPRVDPVWVR